MRLLSRQKPPGELRGLLPKSERLMAWASGPPKLDGQPTVVAASDRALYAPGYVPRVAWKQVLRASWDHPILDVVYLQDAAGETRGTVAVGADDAVLVRITLDAAGAVPQVVWERINSTIVLARHVALVGERGVRFVARRVQASQDVKWVLVFDRGLDPTDPDLRALAEQELGYLRDSAGI